MSGTYKPIAALSPDNQGPANTIVVIVLCATSVLFSTLRYAVGRKKLLQFDSDDATFGIALCFSIATSVVSNTSVGAGLGQHQNALSPERVDRYFKLHWASQFLAIIALAFAKLSIVLMFRRILPAQSASRTLKILIPVIAVYTVICMFLIGFQCQLPSPWVLNPKTCSTHGSVYYVVIGLNIVTDLLLATWILPTVWVLQMKKNLKVLVMTLFASRAAVCIVDVGRLILLRRALHSEDQTWSQLPWVIFDQVIIHLSINHATLPRVHVFLSNLQTGLLVTRLTTTPSTNTKSKGTKHSDDSIPLSGSGGQQRTSRWKLGQYTQGSLSRRKVTEIIKWGPLNTEKEGSVSERPLRLQPEHGIELSTTIYADRDSTGSVNGKDVSREEWGQQQISSGVPITALPRPLPRLNSSVHLKGAASSADDRDMLIQVDKTVEIKMDILPQGR